MMARNFIFDSQSIHTSSDGAPYHAERELYKCSRGRENRLEACSENYSENRS
jgi:hypothetical protein